MPENEQSYTDDYRPPTQGPRELPGQVIRQPRPERKHVVIGDATLILGDALEVLPTLAAGSVDAVVTDPPYGIALRNGDVDGHRSDRWDSIHGDDSEETGRRVIEWARSQPRTVAVFASPDKPWPGRWRNRIVWNKGGAVGGGGDIATCLKRSWELIQVWNHRPMLGPRLESVWNYPIVPADTALHIAAKPVALMRRLVTVFTYPGDLVIDPCMGTGSTGLVCLCGDRRFIGIEIDPHYFAVACQRIRDANGDTGLYAEAKSEPQLFPAEIQ